ncbi:hypothetical protein GJ688_07625 [Heliobacillus mobilis]|uniref:Uncharacterized protein n=1 Tax=Heliobacterium mobile TaxID=28064 RepID=A0A6I3SJ16_HELMO|nr:hypothetical protein [Heliobacterium mobile]MTV48850.1 hypothetical protein [Heliobacterium mobile]
MSKPWFDPETGILLLDEYVSGTDSFQRIMKDGTVSDQEIMEQSHKVVSLLKELESRLSPEEKLLVTDALCELSVLYVLERHRTH